jgi:hypothetical protein
MKKKRGGKCIETQDQTSDIHGRQEDAKKSLNKGELYVKVRGDSRPTMLGTRFQFLEEEKEEEVY